VLFITDKLITFFVAASVVDEPLWPVELADTQLVHHPIYQLPIVVIAGRSRTFIVLTTVFL